MTYTFTLTIPDVHPAIVIISMTLGVSLMIYGLCTAIVSYGIYKALREYTKLPASKAENISRMLSVEVTLFWWLELCSHFIALIRRCVTFVRKLIERRKRA